MKKLLDAPQLQPFLNRANQLSPTSKPQWGNLTVSGMLYHCTLVTNKIMAARSSRKPTLKERLLKPGLYLIPKLPQGIKTGDDLLAQEPDQLNFEEELSAYVDTISRFVRQQEPMGGVHPVFGPLNTQDWRRFVWLHLDHHLRQFGV